MRSPPPEAAEQVTEFLNRWRIFLEDSVFPVLVCDLPSGIVRFVNPAAYALIGGGDITRLEDLSLTPSAIVPGAEPVLLPKHGVYLTVFPLGSGGVLLSLRQRPPQALPALVSQVFNSVPEPTLLVDAGGMILLASPELQKRFPQVQAGRFVAEVLPPPAFQAFSTEHGAFQRVLRPHGASEVIRWRSWRMSVEGQDVSVLCGTDVTSHQDSQLEQALRMRRLEAMHTIALSIGRGEPVAEVGARLLDWLGRLLPIRLARLMLDDGGLVWKDGQVETPIVGSTLPAAEQARHQRAPVSLHLVGALPPDLEALGIQAALLVPLLTDTETLGTLEVYTDVRSDFTTDDEEYVVEAGALLSIALARQRLLEQVTRHAEVLEKHIARRNEELFRTQEQLIHAARLSTIGEMTAGVIHELNQPLNVLSGYVELLDEERLSPEAQKRSIVVMGRAIERMKQIIDNLRNYARTGTDSRAPVELGLVVQMARELTAGAMRRSVALEVPGPVWVLGDQGRLEQVVVNVLANALQAGGDPVTVRVAVEQGEAVIRVSDRGPGVSPELRARIFEPFFTTKPPGQGTGLGLSVSASIMQAHQGRIEVEDAAEGGAVFRLILPLYPSVTP